MSVYKSVYILSVIFIYINIKILKYYKILKYFWEGDIFSNIILEIMSIAFQQYNKYNRIKYTHICCKKAVLQNSLLLYNLSEMFDIIIVNVKME